MSRQSPIRSAALLAAAACAVLPAGAVGITSAGTSFTQVSWDLKQMCETSAQPRQSMTDVWVQLQLRPDLSAQVEAGGVSASDGDTEFEAGDGIAGSAMLAYEPPGRRWRAQFGVGTPCGGELAADERDLLRLLDDPALRFPASSVTRGWQFHLGALGGVALKRGLGLFGGVAADQPLAYDVMPDGRLEPGGRLTVLAGLAAGSERRGADLRLTLSFDSPQQLNDEEICSGRTNWGASASGRTIWGVLRLEGAAAVDISGSVRWPSAVERMVDLHSDPGQLGEVTLGLGLDRGLRLGPGWSVRPALSATYRRFQPADLPYGDGWVSTITPALELVHSPFLLAVDGGWGAGGWRPWCGEAHGPHQDIDGGHVRVALQWAPGSAPGPAPGHGGGNSR